MTFTPTITDQILTSEYFNDAIAFAANVINNLGYTPVNNTIIGIANGIATLDANGHLTPSQIPSVLSPVQTVFGRIGNVVLTNTDVTAALTYTPINPNTLAIVNGIATLDSSGKLTFSQIPSALTGAVIYQGTWDAFLNTPTLTSGTGTKGFYYKVSNAGITNLDGLSTWTVGDTTIFDGTTWDKIDGQANEVISVAGRTGVITLSVTDITGAAATASPALTGTPTAPTPASIDDSTTIATTAFVKSLGFVTNTAIPNAVAFATVAASALTANSVTIHLLGDVTANGTSTGLTTTLSSTTVTPGTYGSSTQIPTFTVDSKGRLTAAANVALDVSSTLGFTPLDEATASVTLSGDVSGTAIFSGNNVTVAATLATVAITPGNYGSATQTVNLTVDQNGRAISASNVAITFPVTDVAGQTGSVTGGTFIAPVTFTAIVSAPTMSPTDNTNNVATTAFVQTSVSSAISTISGSYLPITGGSLTGWLFGQEFNASPGIGGVGFTAPGNMAVGFDASGGTYTNGAIRLAQGQVISLEDTSTINMGLQSGNTFQITSGTFVNLALDQSGNLSALTSIAAPVMTTITQPATDNTTNVATTAFVKTTVGTYQPVLGFTPLNSANASVTLTGDVSGTATFSGNAISVATTFTAVTTSGRNMIHNALFLIWQRGTGTFTSGYTADRWKMDRGTAGGSGSVSRSSVSDTDRTQIGLELARYALAYTCTGGSAAGDQDVLYQRLEDLRRTANQTVAVSFYAKVTSGTPTLGINLAQNFGSGGSPSAIVYLTAQTFSPTTTWQRFSFTFNIPSVQGKTFGTTANTDYLQLQFALSSGSTNATNNGVGVQSVTGFEIFGVQLEIGSVVTALEEQDIRYDMTNCQRFYQTGVIQLEAYDSSGGSGSWVNCSALSVIMRTTPTLTPSFTTQLNCTASLNIFGSYVATKADAAATGQVLVGGVLPQRLIFDPKFL